MLIALLWAFGVTFGAQAPAPLTPAERAIESARQAVAKEPGKAEPYHRLATALARRARETGDSSKYDEAQSVLDKSFELAPDDFEGLKIRAWVLLGKHEFAEALELAQQLNRRAADDATVYGLLTDAHVQLGNYAEAEEAAQWMLDLGRSSIPGLTRAAYLRELFGDVEGAIELMSTAYERIDPVESEERAWVLTQLAHLYWLTGKLEEADVILEEALRLFPDYHYALGNRAKVRSAQGRHEEAEELLRQRYRGAPHPENLFDLAVALERAGSQQEAEEAFAEFERYARAEMSAWDNANLQLISYYADHAGEPSEALRVASLEYERRRDVYTLDAYAWALHVSGRSAEAREPMEKALAVGLRDPKVLYHAGAIALSLSDRQSAERYFRQSLQASSRSEVAGKARRSLERIRAGR